MIWFHGKSWKKSDAFYYAHFQLRRRYYSWFLKPDHIPKVLILNPKVHFAMSKAKCINHPQTGPDHMEYLPQPVFL